MSIVPMKKLALIMQQKDAQAALLKLRALGAVHPQHCQPPAGEQIAALREDAALLEQALAVVSAADCQQIAQQKFALGEDWRPACRHILEAHKRIKHLEEFSLQLENKISEWQEWGDFSPQAIASLAEKGVFVRLLRVREKDLSAFPAAALLRKISFSGGMVNCAVVAREKLELPFKEIEPPKIGLGQMRQRLSEDALLIAGLRQEIKRRAVYRAEMEAFRSRLRAETRFQEALSGMGRQASFAYIMGFIPADAQERVLGLARQQGWGLLLSEPTEEDAVPTLIRAPRWVKLIQPVFRLLEILPGYRELDVSAVFLVFFSIFFGILIGDAGYGLIYFLLALSWHKRRGKQMRDKSALVLFYGLSCCAMTWGLLTGTFFGQAFAAKAGLRPLLPRLNEPKFMQAFCFFLGALHLSVGHCWRAFLKIPSLAALADIGWIGVLWAAFFFAKTLILGEALPFFVTRLLFCGMALVVLFTSPQRNILKGIASGLGTLALSLMNNFTDVVSYVRLFAVGMAGLAIAETANSIAVGAGGNSALGVLATGAILVVGHGLNLLLGPMSVLVHGVRLNVLEFSSHAGISWSGEPYQPLKE